MSSEVATGRLMNSRDGFMGPSRGIGARLLCRRLRRHRRRRLTGRRLILVAGLSMVVLSVAVAARPAAALPLGCALSLPVALSLALAVSMSARPVRHCRSRGWIRNAHLGAV